VLTMTQIKSTVALNLLPFCGASVAMFFMVSNRKEISQATWQGFKLEHKWLVQWNPALRSSC